ncbi:unnamed protein product [Blepharisma stoltei]|uniref:Glutathione synthetase n=1 Tax=Blepharisma stoltei TaxID=1481888 RepID=A0AAU9IJD0_9CILI|nr:unnamed protein product [Blepharisma stoltei]
MLARQVKQFENAEEQRLLALAAAYGIEMSPEANHYTHLPISLLPTPFPAEQFNKLKDLSEEFNLLMYKVHLDREWLYKVLEDICREDDYIRRLVEISKTAHEIGNQQKIFLGLNRNDFMLDVPTNRFQQVEFNTMSASFGGLSSKLYKLHRLILSQYKSYFDPEVDPQKVLETHSMNRLAEGLATASNLYGNNVSVIFLVLPFEMNYFDQTCLEIELWETYSIPVIRATLSDVATHGHKREDGALIYKDKEISVVYFRAGYSPDHYPTESEWQARELIDTSKAVKCPNIDYHLAGSKKIQQELGKPEVLYKYVDPQIGVKLADHFTDLWGFDSPLSQELLAAIRSNPQDYVVKPQREGGGNNFYGEGVVKILENYENDQNIQEHMKQYILMKRINPEPKENLLSRKGVVNRVQTLSELGMFGVLVANGEEIVTNVYGGYLLRTKSKDANEGGVAAGYGVLDSIYLD